MPAISKERLARLKEQREKLNARIQMTEARFKTSERKKDTRKKILLGSYYLNKAIKENSLDEVKSIMDKFLTRDSDRILFDLATTGKEKRKKNA